MLENSNSPSSGRRCHIGVAQSSSYDPTAQLQAAMAAAGIPYTCKRPLKTDGTFNRWHDNGRRGGPLWCVIHELSSGHLVGVFGDWRLSSRFEFKSWEGTDDIPPETARLYAEELERRRRLAEEAETRNKAKVARHAAELWEYLPETGTSEYLERKQVGAHGVRFGADQHGRFIAVPMQNISGTLKSFQKIYDCGRKHFPAGSEKKGAYHLIGQLDTAGDLYLAEGYATAASIHEATGKPVIVAFDAGNLAAVAAALKSIYPDLQLIIAADNDAWKSTELGSDGRPKGNPGIKHAFAVAHAHPGTRVAIPRFENLDTSSKPTDFNDLARLAGIEHVKRQLEQARAPKPQAVNDTGAPDHAPAGRDSIALILNERGNPKSIAFNIQEVLTKDERWLGCFGYDEFTGAPVLLRRPSYDSTQGDWIPRPLQDTDDTQTAIWLQGEYRLCVPSSLVNEVVEVVARRNRFHPVKQYLESITWDGTPRLDVWLRDCFGAPDNAYVRAVSAKALIAAVARVFRPGCKVDSILILEGPQGIGKSLSWRTLAGEFFSDSLPDMHSKDALLHLGASWIIELPELAVLGRSEIESIKRFVSSSVDRYRPPYGRREVKRPRQCVFVGSTNEQAYLKDSTGNRRFWPVTVTRPCDIAKLRADRDQLFAEAVCRFREGEPWHLSPELEQQAAAAQAERLEPDAWEELILPHLTERPAMDFISTQSLFVDVLGIKDPRDWSQVNTKRIGGIMRRNGWLRSKRRIDGEGRQERGYKRPAPQPPQPPGTRGTGPDTTGTDTGPTENANKNNAGTAGTAGTPENKHFKNDDAKNEKRGDCESEMRECASKNVEEVAVPAVPAVPRVPEPPGLGDDYMDSLAAAADAPSAGAAPPKLSSDANTLLGPLAAYRGFEQAELLARRLRWDGPEGVTRVLHAAVELQSAGLAVVSNGAIKPVQQGGVSC